MGLGEGLVGGLLAADDLDELHDRGGIEEVQAQDGLGALGGGGDLVDGDAGGVGQKDGVLVGELVHLLERGLLEVQALGNGLDDELGAGQLGVVGAVGEAVEDGLTVLGAHLVLVDLLLEELGDKGLGLVERGLGDVDVDHGEAGLSAGLGDAATHKTAADNRNLDVVHVSSFLRSSCLCLVLWCR